MEANLKLLWCPLEGAGIMFTGPVPPVAPIVVTVLVGVTPVLVVSLYDDII